MNIDTSEMDPLSASQAQMFATMMETAPADWVRFLRVLCTKELEERGEPLD